MPVKRTIILVDDDMAVCHALSMLLETSGYRVKVFHSAEAFLEGAENVLEGVMLLDQRMTGMSGLELQTELARRGIDLSIIFITGHGDVQMSVKAIKAGAVDFLEKPFSNEELLACVREASVRADKSKQQRTRLSRLQACHASLTEREREVLQHVVAGMTNRVLAKQLGVSDRTIEVHRSRVMKKMEVETLAELVRQYALIQESGR